MVAPFTDISENATGIIDLIGYVNYLTNGMFGVVFLAVIGVVAFISTKSYPADRSFAFASFLVSICAIFLRFMNLINDGVLAFAIVLMVIGIIMLIKERDSEGL